MKRIRQVIKQVIVIMCMSATFLSTAGAADYSVKDTNIKNSLTETVYAGDQFINAEGKIERVVRVNEDGSFISEEITGRAQKQCTHPANELKAKENLKDEISIVKKAGVCYKHRSVTLYQCNKCLRNIKLRGKWVNVTKHYYPLLKKTCSICGYKK